MQIQYTSNEPPHNSVLTRAYSGLAMSELPLSCVGEPLKRSARTPLTVEAISWPQELRAFFPQVTSSVLDFDNAAIDVTSALECAAEPAAERQ